MKPDGYCRECGGRLYREGDTSLAACPACGSEFSWQDESTWAESYVGSRAALRQAGGAAFVLALLFAISAAGEGSPRWLLAFAVSAIVLAAAARRWLR